MIPVPVQTAAVQILPVRVPVIQDHHQVQVIQVRVPEVQDPAAVVEVIKAYATAEEESK